MRPSLRHYIEENKPIYVINRTKRILGETVPYLLQIQSDGNKTRQIAVPATKYPFCLSDQVPTKHLINASELFTAISKGILELVDPTDARDQLSDPMASKVVDHALRRFQPVKRTGTKKPDVQFQPQGPNESNRGPRMQQDEPDPLSGPQLRVAEDQDDDAPEVNASVVRILKDLDSDASLRDEKLLELAALTDLTEQDYGYVLSTCPVTKIKQWARDELAKLVGEEQAAEIESDIDSDVEEGSERPRIRRRKRRR